MDEGRIVPRLSSFVLCVFVARNKQIRLRKNPRFAYNASRGFFFVLRMLYIVCRFGLRHTKDDIRYTNKGVS